MTTVESLDRVLFRLVSSEDDALPGILDKLLPALLNILEPGLELPVRKKLMDIFSHINTRVRDQKDFQLPVMSMLNLLRIDTPDCTSSDKLTSDKALLKIAHSSSIITVYVKMGLSRLSASDFDSIAPTLFATHLFHQSIRPYLMSTVVSRLKDVHVPVDSELRRKKFELFLSSPESQRSIRDELMNTMMYTRCYITKTDDNPLRRMLPGMATETTTEFVLPAGLSRRTVGSILSSSNLSPESLMEMAKSLKPNEMHERKRGILRLISSELFTPTDVVLVALSGLCDTHHEIVEQSNEIIRRISQLELERTEMIDNLFELFLLGSPASNTVIFNNLKAIAAKSGQKEPLRSESDRLPLPPSVRMTILQLCTRVKTSASDSLFSKALKVILDGWFGTVSTPPVHNAPSTPDSRLNSPNSPSSPSSVSFLKTDSVSVLRLQQSTSQFAQHVFHQASSRLLSTFAPMFLQSLLKLLKSMSPEEGVNEMNPEESVESLLRPLLSGADVDPASVSRLMQRADPETLQQLSSPENLPNLRNIISSFSENTLTSILGAAQGNRGREQTLLHLQQQKASQARARLRELLYSAIGILATRAPSAFINSCVVPRTLFVALARESGSARLAVYESLSLLSGVYSYRKLKVETDTSSPTSTPTDVTPSPAVIEELHRLLNSRALRTHPEPKVRMAVLDWAKSVFRFSDIRARFLCLRMLDDVRQEVRDSARAGLRLVNTSSLSMSSSSSGATVTTGTGISSNIADKNIRSDLTGIKRSSAVSNQQNTDENLEQESGIDLLSDEDSFRQLADLFPSIYALLAFINEPLTPLPDQQQKNHGFTPISAENPKTDDEIFERELLKEVGLLDSDAARMADGSEAPRMLTGETEALQIMQEMDESEKSVYGSIDSSQNRRYTQLSPLSLAVLLEFNRTCLDASAVLATKSPSEYLLSLGSSTSTYENAVNPDAPACIFRRLAERALSTPSRARDSHIAHVTGASSLRFLMDSNIFVMGSIYVHRIPWILRFMEHANPRVRTCMMYVLSSTTPFLPFFSGSNKGGFNSLEILFAYLLQGIPRQQWRSSTSSSSSTQSKLKLTINTLRRAHASLVALGFIIPLVSVGDIGQHSTSVDNLDYGLEALDSDAMQLIQGSESPFKDLPVQEQKSQLLRLGVERILEYLWAPSELQILTEGAVGALVSICRSSQLPLPPGDFHSAAEAALMFQKGDFSALVSLFHRISSSSHKNLSNPNLASTSSHIELSNMTASKAEGLTKADVVLQLFLLATDTRGMAQRMRASASSTNADKVSPEDNAYLRAHRVRFALEEDESENNVANSGIGLAAEAACVCLSSFVSGELRGCAASLSTPVMQSGAVDEDEDMYGDGESQNIQTSAPHPLSYSQIPKSITVAVSCLLALGSVTLETMQETAGAALAECVGGGPAKLIFSVDSLVAAATSGGSDMELDFFSGAAAGTTFAAALKAEALLAAPTSTPSSSAVLPFPQLTASGNSNEIVKKKHEKDARESLISRQQGALQALLLEKVLKYLFQVLAGSSKSSQRAALTIWLHSFLSAFARDMRALNTQTEPAAASAPVVKVLWDNLGAFQTLLTQSLTERSPVTQDAAAQALALLYDSSPPETRTGLVTSLVDALGMGKKLASVAAVQGLGLLSSTPNSVDTSIGNDAKSTVVTLLDSPPESDNKISSGPLYTQSSMGGDSSYREMCALASDSGQPDLIYRFLALAAHNANWHARGGASVGLEALLRSRARREVYPHIRKLIPKLVRFQYDPAQSVRSAMTSLWSTLVKNPRRTIDTHFGAILRDLISAADSGSWRERESACLALADLLPQRVWKDFLVSPDVTSPFSSVSTSSIAADEGGDKSTTNTLFIVLWRSVFRACDDVKESVRESAEMALKELVKLSLRICSPLYGVSDSAAALAALLPYLLEEGVTSPVQHAQRTSIEVVVELAKSAGSLLVPHLPTLIHTMLQALSSFESEGLAYLQTHAGGASGIYGEIDAEKLELLRLNAARQSPFFAVLENAVRVMSGLDFYKLTGMQERSREKEDTLQHVLKLVNDRKGGDNTSEGNDASGIDNSTTTTSSEVDSKMEGSSSSEITVTDKKMQEESSKSVETEVDISSSLIGQVLSVIRQVLRHGIGVPSRGGAARLLVSMCQSSTLASAISLLSGVMLQTLVQLLESPSSTPLLRQEMAAAAAAVAQRAQERPLARLLRRLTQLSRSADDNVRLTAGVAFQKLANVAGERLRVSAAVVLPCLFLASLDPVTSVSSLFGEALESAFAGDSSVKLWIPEVAASVCAAAGNASWAVRRQAARAALRLHSLAATGSVQDKAEDRYVGVRATDGIHVHTGAAFYNRHIPGHLGLGLGPRDCVSASSFIALVGDVTWEEIVRNSVPTSGGGADNASASEAINRVSSMRAALLARMQTQEVNDLKPFVIGVVSALLASLSGQVWPGKDDIVAAVGVLVAGCITAFPIGSLSSQFSEILSTDGVDVMEIENDDTMSSANINGTENAENESMSDIATPVPREPSSSIANTDEIASVDTTTTMFTSTSAIHNLQMNKEGAPTLVSIVGALLTQLGRASAPTEYNIAVADALIRILGSAPILCESLYPLVNKAVIRVLQREASAASQSLSSLLLPDSRMNDLMQVKEFEKTQTITLKGGMGKKIEAAEGASRTAEKANEALNAKFIGTMCLLLAAAVPPAEVEKSPLLSFPDGDFYNKEDETSYNAAKAALDAKFSRITPQISSSSVFSMLILDRFLILKEVLSSSEIYCLFAAFQNTYSTTFTVPGRLLILQALQVMISKLSAKQFLGKVDDSSDSSTLVDHIIRFLTANGKVRPEDRFPIAVSECLVVLVVLLQRLTIIGVQLESLASIEELKDMISKTSAGVERAAVAAIDINLLLLKIKY